MHLQMQAGTWSEAKRKEGGVAKGTAGHRPPDFLGRLGICRANTTDRFLQPFLELIKGRGLVRDLTDISLFLLVATGICTIQSDGKSDTH